MLLLSRSSIYVVSPNAQCSFGLPLQKYEEWNHIPRMTVVYGFKYFLLSFLTAIESTGRIKPYPGDRHMYIFYAYILTLHIFETKII